jgi:hypothetical protein
VAAVVALLPAIFSYLQALAQPSNSSFGIRSVEWLRDHGAAGIVSEVETIYYSLTAPAKGGPTLKALPNVGYATAPRGAHGGRGAPGGGGEALGARGRTLLGARRVPFTAPQGLAAARALGGEPSAYRPPRVRPLLYPALPGEGMWRSARPTTEADPPLLLTTLRNQPEYPRALAGLAWIDPTRTTIALTPGRLEPDVTLPRGPMEVPMPARGKLLATFNSAFKLSDSHGGFVLNGHTYAPMRNGQATLVGYRNGKMDVIAWPYGPTAPSGVSFARQNLPLIVDRGRPSPNLNDSSEWGATLGSAILVWRSAIGVDRRGDLLYLAGNDQTVGSLANTLVRAGAVRAMELDINSYWVSFIAYGAPGARQPANLLPDMNRSATRYLTPDDRDFFAVYAR